MPMNTRPVTGELDGLLAFLDHQREAVRNACFGLTDDGARAAGDLGRPVPLPPAPWHPEGCTVRWILLHLIEETARHAGHADLLREALDGALSGPLMAAAEGWPADGWVTPWQPALSGRRSPPAGDRLRACPITARK
jgi:Protein of unknown function (DUF664)